MSEKHKPKEPEKSQKERFKEAAKQVWPDPIGWSGFNLSS
jgi:hypothetical protein